MGFYCPICEEESDVSYKCSSCGKPAEGDQDASGEQQLRPDGGPETVDLDSLSTHDLVLEALYALDDFDTENGVHAIEVAKWITNRTEVSAADVHDAISYLDKRGGVYMPAPGVERYRRRERDLRRWSQ